MHKLKKGNKPLPMDAFLFLVCLSTAFCPIRISVSHFKSSLFRISPLRMGGGGAPWGGGMRPSGGGEGGRYPHILSRSKFWRVFRRRIFSFFVHSLGGGGGIRRGVRVREDWNMYFVCVRHNFESREKRDVSMCILIENSNLFRKQNSSGRRSLRGKSIPWKEHSGLELVDDLISIMLLSAACGIGCKSAECIW